MFLTRGGAFSVLTLRTTFRALNIVIDSIAFILDVDILFEILIFYLLDLSQHDKRTLPPCVAKIHINFGT